MQKVNIVINCQLLTVHCIQDHFWDDAAEVEFADVSSCRRSVALNARRNINNECKDKQVAPTELNLIF